MTWNNGGDIAFQIFKLRAAAQTSWRRSLVQAAASGDWASRRLLQKRQPLLVAARPLLDKFHGDRNTTAEAVKKHFQDKFLEPEGQEPLDLFLDLPDCETPFLPTEVGRAVASLKPNKTTGMSRVSVGLLKNLIEADYGLQLLCDLFNAFLFGVATIPSDLANGWVILLPKKAWIDKPEQFRPIVCGEVLLKVLAKLAMNRIADKWSMPKCCFGACRGRGVPEALYTVKHCAQEVGGLQDATVFLQLDVSSAFDSLKLQAILAFFRSQWDASTGKSCKLLQWVLSHSLLRFQLFDTIWAIQQEVGTQQGATHSPTLFGRIVAHHFDDLCREWEAAREIPAFIVGDTSLWGIWFIDDTLCFFRNSAQFSRLVPKLISMLGGLGLRVNISKSCTMSCQGPPRQLTCLPALPHLAESTYLGHKLLLAQGDDHLLQGFLRRTSSAFFSNRPPPGAVANVPGPCH